MIATVLTLSFAVSGATLDDEFGRARKLLMVAAYAGDVRAFELLAARVEKEWRATNSRLYPDMMLAVVRAFHSIPSNGSPPMETIRIRKRAREVAIRTLLGPVRMPIEVEVKLLMGLYENQTEERQSRTEDEWIAFRRNRTELWLGAWNRLHNALDPNWDPDDQPLRNVSPPAATGLPSGVAPTAIKDAALRAEYEAAIARNREKAEHHLQQSTRRKLRKQFVRHAERCIIELFRQGPNEPKLLQLYLSQYVDDEVVRARIQAAVEAE